MDTEVMEVGQADDTVRSGVCLVSEWNVRVPVSPSDLSKQEELITPKTQGQFLIKSERFPLEA